MSVISTLTDCYKKNTWFFIPYFIFIIIGGIFLTITNKGEDIIILNSYHCYAFDFFFKYITYVGDGIFLAFLLIPMIIIRIRYFLFLFFSFLVTGGSAQILKHIFNFPRPKAFFSQPSLLHFVPGVDVYMSYSFPSGHTATSFAMFLMLSIISKRNPLKLFYFISAIIVGISRIYLLQHFFIDVYFGSIVGVIFSLLVYLFFVAYWKNKDLYLIDNGIASGYSSWRYRQQLRKTNK